MKAFRRDYYGGTERIIAYLVDGLVDLGHDVTLFASADARTKARLVPVRDRALRLDPESAEFADRRASVDARRGPRRADEFDVIHFHLSHFIHFPFFEHMPERTVTTPHGRLDYEDLRRRLCALAALSDDLDLDQQRLPLPQANWVATIHHGLPLDLYRPLPSGKDRGGYLAFLGRLSRDKRPDRAIEIARRAGLELRIAAKIDDDDRAYFHDTIEPLIDGERIKYVGEIGEAEKQAFLGNAAALLFPIDWPEPFGLVVIEAMACGTPVDRLGRGRDARHRRRGRDGLRRGLDRRGGRGGRQAWQRSTAGACDRSSSERFSADRMVRDYAAVYARLLEPAVRDLPVTEAAAAAG